jgi:hypothetical protein
MKVDDLSIYLPKYLSQQSYNALLTSIKDFPKVSPDRFYTTRLQDAALIFQGDGITRLLYVELPSLKAKEVNAMVLSNTCDLDPANERVFESKMMYSPIIELSSYISFVEKSAGKSPDYIPSHLASIRAQQITSIFYLPEIPEQLNESIVFLDDILNLPSDYIRPEEVRGRRIFTLSDYGYYLFLFKLSFHLTRIQEKVDRDAGTIIS